MTVVDNSTTLCCVGKNNSPRARLLDGPTPFYLPVTSLLAVFEKRPGQSNKALSKILFEYFPWLSKTVSIKHHCRKRPLLCFFALILTDLPGFRRTAGKIGIFGRSKYKFSF